MADQRPSPPLSSPKAVSELDFVEGMTSSPLLPDAVLSGDGGKLRKPPTITPRTFKRFFTPRSTPGRVSKVSASRRALYDITSPAINLANGTKDRGLADTDGFMDITPSDKENVAIGLSVGPKKRRILISPDTSPDQSTLKKPRRISIYKDVAATTKIRMQEVKEEPKDEDQDACRGDDESDGHVDRPAGSQAITAPLPVRRARLSGSTRRILQRSIGLGSGSGLGLGRMDLAGHCADWQTEAANFYTRPEDAYVFRNNGSSDGALPFGITSCNTNSLVAVADEEGNVRLLESVKGGKPAFSKAYLTFRPHTNVILDMTFSSNDLLLATASGDQTAKIIDMPTQRTITTLSGHGSSIKQVRFQPGSGSDSVIATSSRDGSVQIWDLRCTGSNAPSREVHVSLDGSGGGACRSAAKKMTWGRSVNAIFEAHAERSAQDSLHGVLQGVTSNGSVSVDGPLKSETTPRSGAVSVTALDFMPPAREHLLLTASEANASIKLWDLRTTHNGRRGKATPLSSTRQPDSHTKHRHFGVNSLTLSSDGGRLYTLCRDSTIYAYSTSHLILGDAPELSDKTTIPRRSGGVVKDGLGPIYGFRHRQMHASTFYVKAALRRAIDDKTEMMAVGSSDGCAVLFPTDERYLNKQALHQGGLAGSLATPASTPLTPRPTLTRTMSKYGLSVRPDDTIPIYQHGSALIRGHEREVTGLCWTSEGELVTVGDDLLARCWREGPDARDLRIGGESEGRRWGCGWAEVREDYDDYE